MGHIRPLSKKMRHWSTPWIGALTALALIVVFPSAAGAQEIRIGGTGGALATMELLADVYGDSHPGETITVLPSLGSSGGIKALLAGAIQVAVSSRVLKPSEAEQGAVGLLCGRTPFVFVTHPQTMIDGITEKDLVDIYTGTTKHWPDGTKIRLVLRPVGESNSQMVRNISPAVREAKILSEKRPGMPFAITDQDAADAMEKLSGSFGTSTLAQILTEKRALKPLSFNGVEPSLKTIADESYPYSKPLILVTGPKTSKPARKFVNFFNSAAGREILLKNGYTLADEK